jgi:hypothetical protein
VINNLVIRFVASRLLSFGKSIDPEAIGTKLLACLYAGKKHLLKY